MRATGMSAFLSVLPPLALTLAASAQGLDEEQPLPRWREGGTPYDPAQSLVPYAVRAAAAVPGTEMPPKTGLLESPPEYAPAQGVLFRFTTSSWASVVIDCVVSLTADPAFDDIAYVSVPSTAQMNSAISAFTNNGADMSKVKFIVQPSNSIWLRDYGPHFTWQAGTRVIADSHYYPTRPLDNFTPTLLADNLFHIPRYAMGLYYSGGNFQPGPNRSGFVTALIRLDNPEMSDQEIADLYHDYQGIDTLHIMPQLPFSVDGTGHIDMWMYLVDEDDVIISEFKPGSNATAIQITDNAVPYMQALGFNVTRVPAWNVGNTHYTYTNAFRVNDRIFVPIYGPGNANYLPDDQAALAAWAAAAGPGVQIVPINCYSIIPAAGAIHCIVMQVPRFTDTLPKAHVLSPAGGEYLVSGEPYDIEWSADDDVAVRLVQLEYSLDGGQTFPYTISLAERDDGVYTWDVPYTAGTDAIVRTRALDTAGGTVEAVSEAPFEINRARRKVYDFKQNAGVDRWVWGYQTSSWSDLEGVRYPALVATEIEALVPGAYAALASSDATGGDTDPARYITPVPVSQHRTTHVAEFTIKEPTSCLLDLELLWEGYGDQCLQMELYVWDNVAQNWCDAVSKFGQNAYAQNWAGNLDEPLRVNIRKDFDRFVDANKRLTLLLYGERVGQESFHDYLSVTTTFQTCP